MIDSRRLPALLLAFVMLIAIPVAHAREMVSVARGEVNLRSGPGKRYDITWALSRGYPLSVLAHKGRWLKVRDFEKDEGWIYRSLTGRIAHYVVKASVANMRGTPSTRARIVGKALYGDVLRTLERHGSWVKVRHEGGPTGWVARSLLWGW